MRLGFFSPLPPSRSGIADYSAELLRRFPPDFDVETFDSTPEGFDPGSFDLLLYQIGNNPFHAHAYRMALRHPGVVVLHEFNLHHLIADLTIKRGDWDAYMEEVAYDGGAGALEYARRVRALEVGPDYEGVPMMRRLLSASKGIVVHSRHMADKVREAGFQGPLATIPHGAWLSEANRMGYRQRLGIDEATPLIGIFGFLKPYKRIAESLRGAAPSSPRRTAGEDDSRRGAPSGVATRFPAAFPGIVRRRPCPGLHADGRLFRLSGRHGYRREPALPDCR